MAVYDMQVPEFNTIDALAEAREQRDQRTRARMNKKAYLDEILAVLGSRWTIHALDLVRS